MQYKFTASFPSSTVPYSHWGGVPGVSEEKAGEGGRISRHQVQDGWSFHRGGAIPGQTGAADTERSRGFRNCGNVSSKSYWTGKKDPFCWGTLYAKFKLLSCNNQLWYFLMLASSLWVRVSSHCITLCYNAKSIFSFYFLCWIKEASC